MKPHTVNPPRSTVTTQAELDAALADDAIDEILIRSKRGVWLEIRTTNDKEVRAYDSATVSAYDSATVSAYASATVSASSHVAVHLHSGSCQVNGGVLIDHTAIDQSEPATWCSYHGATVSDEHAVLYKAVRKDWRSAHGTSYEPGTTATCEDFLADGCCGGGLHVSQTPTQAGAYDGEATRYVEVRLPLAGINVIGSDKIKAAVVECVREVDVHGDPIQSDGDDK